MFTKLIAAFYEAEMAVTDKDKQARLHLACVDFRNGNKIPHYKLKDELIIDAFKKIHLTGNSIKDIHYEASLGFTTTHGDNKYVYDARESKWRTLKLNYVDKKSFTEFHVRMNAYFLEMQRTGETKEIRDLAAIGLAAKNINKAIDIYFKMTVHNLPLRVAYYKVLYEASDIDICTVGYDKATKEITGMSMATHKLNIFHVKDPDPGCWAWGI